MKKIVFGLQTMVMGGVEKELVSLLRNLDQQEWDITVMVLYIADASITQLLPQGVKFVNIDIDRNYYCSDTLTAARMRLKKGEWGEAISLLFKKAFKIGQTGANVNISKIPALEESYDTAVCYHIHSPLMVKYMAEKVRAKSKLAWIHNDFSTSGYRVDKIQKYIGRYNKIFGVSAKITEEFKALCPNLSSRTKVMYNALDRDEILTKADEAIIEMPVGSRPVLLTVGRMEEQKGYDIAVVTASILKSRGFDFLWLFIGDGTKTEEVKNLINELGLQDKVILLGRRDNPYPFMRHCNIYVQSSRHEGYALTVIEAKLLNKPIICTDFAGAKEQIIDGVNGMVVERNNPEVLADAISSLLNNNEMQNNFINALIEENKSYKGFSEIITCF